MEFREGKGSRTFVLHKNFIFAHFSRSFYNFCYFLFFLLYNLQKILCLSFSFPTRTGKIRNLAHGDINERMRRNELTNDDAGEVYLNDDGNKNNLLYKSIIIILIIIIQ